MDYIRILAELRGMLLLLERYRLVRLFLWAVLLTVPLTILIWKLADILNALK